MTTMTATIHRTRTRTYRPAAHRPAAHRPAAQLVRRPVARPAAHRPDRRVTPSAVVTARRRVATVVAIGVLSLAGLGLHGVLSRAGDVPASAAGAGPAPVTRSIKAHPGDTLWSIAETHRGDIPIQRYIDALVELNGGATRIDAGQLVHLP